MKCRQKIAIKDSIINNPFLGGLSSAEFLADYWQKQPLLIKNAYPQASKLATFDDFVELAECDPFETRKIIKKSEQEYEVLDGPFTKQDLSLDRNDYTFLVHGLNLYFAEFRTLAHEIRFLPDWIFDDIMGSYSAKGAVTAAHIDNYNVFLLQGCGQRKWEINTKPDKRIIENCDLKLLANFIAETEFTLEAGDMLYLPPHVAHQATALTHTLSYSIGFKAFNHNDLVSSYLNDIFDSFESHNFLKTEFKNKIEDPFVIADEHFKQIKAAIKAELLDEARLDQWLGRYLTQPRFPFEAEKNVGQFIFKDEHLRFTMKNEGGKVRLMLPNADYLLSQEDYREFVKLVDIPASQALVTTNLSPKNKAILKDGLETGYFFKADD